jgi:UDP-N-acetylglucosamine:LPS N-acetylglucosamine transferase
MLKGNMKIVGLVYDLIYFRKPSLIIPKNGTARNTQIANAAVVESDPVGGTYHGNMIQILANAMNRNNDPMNPIYSLVFFKPTSFI